MRSKVGEKYIGMVVEGSGHWPHVDKEEEKADALKEFAHHELIPKGIAVPRP